MSIIRKIFGCLPYYLFPQNKQETKTQKKPQKSFDEVLSECKSYDFVLSPFIESYKDNTSVLDSYNDKHLF